MVFPRSAFLQLTDILVRRNTPNAVIIYYAVRKRSGIKHFTKTHIKFLFTLCYGAA
jgi:hypothetical protein